MLVCYLAPHDAHQSVPLTAGSHVRDAACYVCWSFARAYEPQQLKPHVSHLARHAIVHSEVLY